MMTCYVDGISCFAICGDQPCLGSRSYYPPAHAIKPGAYPQCQWSAAPAEPHGLCCPSPLRAESGDIPSTFPAVSLGSWVAGRAYDAIMASELKGWLFLLASLFLLMLICGLAMLGILTRPVRWTER